MLKIFKLATRGYFDKAEKHFEALKDTSLPLPIWYQDGLTKQWKSGKLILQGKRYAYIFPDRSNKVSWLLLQKIHPQRTTNIQDRKKQNPQEEEVPVQAMAALEISKKCCTQRHLPHDPPTWRQIKTLTNKGENLVSQQGMPRNPENIFVAMLALLASCPPPPPPPPRPRSS